MLMTTMAALISCSTPDTIPSPGEDRQEENKSEPKPEPSDGKTLVIYYSYTGNTRAIVDELKQQITCDMVEVIPEGAFTKSLWINAGNHSNRANLIKKWLTENSL